MSEVGQQSDALRAEAAQWVSRLNSLPVSRETLEQFFAWKRDGANSAAYDEAASLWSAVGDLADRPAMQALAQEAYDKGGAPKPKVDRQRTKLLAAMLLPAAAVAVLVAAGTGIIPWRPAGTSYATRAGEQSVVTLPDGSKLALDTDTKLVVRYDKAARHIDLERGQAYFTVAHNAARPFVVDADDTDVTATGTQFEVRRRDAGIDVTLVEGSVRVTPPRQPATEMVAGQQLVLRADRPAVLQHVDIAAATSWRQGRIVLNGMSLADAIAEVNRYAQTPVRLDADRFADNRFGGSFETGDVNGFVAAATALLPLKAERAADGSIHLSDADAKSSGS